MFMERIAGFLILCIGLSLVGIIFVHHEKAVGKDNNIRSAIKSGCSIIDDDKGVKYQCNWEGWSNGY